jgi:uncharacterized protein (TIGR03067 family)
MRTGATLLLVVAFASPVRADDDLQGTWNLLEQTVGGKSLDSIKDEITAVICSDKIEFHVGDNKDRTEKFHVVLDSTVTPKAIDLHKFADGKAGDKFAEGLYEIDGDKLRLCVKLQSGPPWSRPTMIQSTEEGEEFLMVFRREPKAK